MKYKKLRLKTTTGALDYMGAIAMDLGLEGFEIEDNVPLTKEEKESMFIDILPELPPDEGEAYVTFYVDTETDEEALIKDIRSAASDYAGVCDFGELSLTVSLTDENDWINNWKEFFHPFRIDENIVIKPTWEDYKKENKDELVLEIDPGTAFGTGSHETTRLCILALEKYLRASDTVLDIGCGSGILSIAAIKLGAEKAVGIDVDSIAVETSISNAKVNNTDKIKFSCGNVISDHAYAETVRDMILPGADIVVANILADIIIPLSETVPAFLKKGGLFISSGIINTKEEDVKQALLGNGFTIVEVMHMNDWVSIAARY